MALSRETVEHVARLAHMGLTSEEIDVMTRDLASVVEHVGLLQAVDTSDVPPTAHMAALQNVTAPDEVRPSWAQHMVLANAPRREDGLFEVQAILD